MAPHASVTLTSDGAGRSTICAGQQPTLANQLNWFNPSIAHGFELHKLGFGKRRGRYVANTFRDPSYRRPGPLCGA
jgi:hypothetical protein